VDLWDLFRVLFRRWYLTVPLLVLVAGVGYYSAKGIEPTYTASAGGVFLEPVVLLPVEQRAPNPWAQAGVATTAAAVVGSVVDPVTKEQVVAEGYSGDYSVQLASRSVLFSIYAPAASHEAAIATLDHVIELMKEDLRAKQSAYGVPENQQINIQLASGTSIVSTREGVSRVLLGLGGLGAVLTVGIVVLVDSLLTRRRRRAELDEVAAPSDDDVAEDSRTRPPRSASKSSRRR